MTRAHENAPTCPVHTLEQAYDPFSPPQLDDPQPIWARARGEQPVFHSAVLDAWVVTRHADVVRVLKDRDRFGPGYGSRKLFAAPCPEADAMLDALPQVEETNTISTEPPLHTKLRRYLQPALMPRRTAALEPEMQAIAHRLIDRMDEKGHADFYAEYAHPYPLSVIGHLVGVPESMHRQIVDWANQRVDLRFGNLPAEAQIAAARGQQDSHAYTSGLVAERRATPGEDLVSWMVQDSDSSDDPLSDDQLAAQVTDMLSAGHETSAHFLVLMLHRVLPDRELWAALPGRPDLVTWTVEEALRLVGPAQAIWREAKHDTEISGVTIPAGARVSVVLGSANHDEQVFEAPDDFRLGRSNASQHVAFGRGIHTCVGAAIARAEMRTSLESLASRLPNLRLAADDGLIFRPSAIQRSAKRLYLEWT